MNEHEGNPYESPTAEDTPYRRLSGFGRFVAWVGLIVVTIASFSICFCAVCFGEAVLSDVASGRFMEFFVFSGLGFLTSLVISAVVAGMVARWLARRWIWSKEDE